VTPADAPRVWRRVEEAGPHLALTVDDCDRPRAWQAILDVLVDGGARATFFASGVRVVQHPELAGRTVEEGHAIGSHGWDHARATELASEELRWRLDQDDQAWRATAGVSPKPYFRPPYGACDVTTVEDAAAAGYTRTVLWDVDPEDWREPGPGVVATRTLSGVTGGSIVVLHAVEQTAAALPTILAGLLSRGLAPVTLPELFSLARAA
jgi:peptidoglycan/xylan/chitin deacetylase (PgdA/CDA1 family)